MLVNGFSVVGVVVMEVKSKTRYHRGYGSVFLQWLSLEISEGRKKYDESSRLVAINYKTCVQISVVTQKVKHNRKHTAS